MPHTNPTTPALSIVVPTHGRGPKLQNLLARLATQTLAPERFEVIVVDDGSPEPVQIDAARLPYRCELLRQPQRGPAAARNRAIERCSAPLLLIVNDDTVPAPDLLERHLAAHREAARRGLGDVAVLGTFRFTTEARKSPFTQVLDESELLFDHHHLRHDQLHGWQYFWTCNLSVPRHAVLAVGGFDGHLFDRAICEDVELGYRLEQRGIRVLYREDCVAHHDHVLSAQDYFARHARLGFYCTRLWAKHQQPAMLWAKDQDGVQAHFDTAVTQIERLSGHPEQLTAALARFEQEYAGQTLSREVVQQVAATMRAVSMSAWYRGIHLARHGVDPYAVRAEGAAEGTRVTVVIVSCNALENTRRCLASLRAAADPRYPQAVFVVDNGSTDGSREWLAQQGDITLVQNPTNQGAPRARNQALRIAQERGLGDWVAFLDNDVVVPRGWLERALYHGAIDPAVGSVALCANRASKLQVVPYSGETSQAAIDTFAARHHASAPRTGQDTVLFTSLGVLVRRAVIERIGGFDEAFSPWGFEDDDLSLRIKLSGWRNRVARDTFVHHAHYATQEKAQRHHNWMEENWRRFVAKWCGPVPTPKLFDFAKLVLPTLGQATHAQLVFALPAADAPIPRWPGDGRDGERAGARVVEVVPATRNSDPKPARSWWDAPPAPQQSDIRRSGDPRCNVVVLGSGRSGTSMVTGMLAEAGWFVGDSPYPGRPANPRGFFETAEINGINECLLSVAARGEAPLGRMQHWLVAPREQLTFDVEPGLAERMERLGRRGPFAYKDPRFCHTLPAWRAALPDTKFVCIFRDPAATADSIVRECRTEEYLRSLDMPFEGALEVWKRSYERVLATHRHTGQWLFLHYDQLFTAAGVERLEAFVGGRVAADFAERGLSRSRGTRPVDGEAARIYGELCALAQHVAAPIAVADELGLGTATTRSGASAPELSVIVCTYNRLATLKRCLGALDEQTAGGRFEVIVVDDGSSDGTSEWLSGRTPIARTKVVRRQNGGLAAARNTGLQHAAGALVLFVNDDTIASRELVAEHLAAHARLGAGYAVLGTFEQPRRALDNALTRTLEARDLVFGYGGLSPETDHDWNAFWTCNVSVPRRAVSEVGGFDEAFRHYGCEDTDLGYRLVSQLGLRVRYVPEARAQHDHVLGFEDVRRRTRAVASAWTQFFQKHPGALVHPTWRERVHETVEGLEEYVVRTLPERGRAEAFAAELARIDVGALERTGPEGARLAEAVVEQLGQYLVALRALWWAEGERDALRRAGVAGMRDLVVRARVLERAHAA